MWVDIAECAEKLETTLTNLALSNGGSATVNIVPLASSCTLDIIGRVGFGHDFNFGKSPEAQEMAASWNQVINSGLTFRAFISRFILRAFPSITSLPLKVLRAQGEYKEVIGKLAKNIIQDGLHQEKRKNLLSILMTAQSEDDGLATPRIIDNIITFTFAGHETTSGILSFTLLELARHPDVQQKLRDEVIQYGGSLSYDGIQKLAYLDAVIKEGLRIHPPSARTERVAMKDDTIPLTFPIKAKYGRLLKSFIVSKGQVFHIPFTSMQVNPSVWGTDAAEFKPERWLTPGAMPPPKELPHGWSNLVAFCDGPRNCIGFRLALLEFKVILATLVRTLEFRTTDAIITTKLSVTLQAVVEGQAGIIPLKVTLPSHT
ncbi:cytochrome P450 [Rickenella mellea]|uniref:Cytochrome P450 n=1 Tax=Rickenella mellea TaxID=50990 RepID=A0A4Y7Q9M4_9AGAM|nr:cytochrome P450 [Rickenella mellea]